MPQSFMRILGKADSSPAREETWEAIRWPARRTRSLSEKYWRRSAGKCSRPIFAKAMPASRESARTRPNAPSGRCGKECRSRSTTCSGRPRLQDLLRSEQQMTGWLTTLATPGPGAAISRVREPVFDGRHTAATCSRKHGSRWPGLSLRRTVCTPRSQLLAILSRCTIPNLYIDGRWQPSAGSNKINVLSASTEEVIGSIPEGTPADVDRAAAAARRAFDRLVHALPREERAEWLDKLAAALKERADAIARTIAMEVGSPMSIAAPIQAGLPVAVTAELRQAAALKRSSNTKSAIRWWCAKPPEWWAPSRRGIIRCIRSWRRSRRRWPPDARWC